MVISIITAVGAATTALTWAMDKSLEIEAQDNANQDMAIRTLAGAAASRPGNVKDVEVGEFVEVPEGDPAFLGKAVLLTHQEAIWWMEACKSPEDHIPEIRRIMAEQEIRRMACSVR